MRTYKWEIRLIQLGVLLAVLVVIGGIINPSLWGEESRSTAEQTGNSQQTAPKDGVTPLNAASQKIVALGDSFTLGYPGTVDEAWPKRLGDVLKTEVVNKGKQQQTAQSLLDRFDQDVVAEKPGIVIIFAGDGDALQEVSLDDFEKNITALVEKAQSSHITPVLALPLPYEGVQTTIRSMRRWEADYAEKEKIRVLDFSSVLMDVEGNYLDGMSANGKYPSAKGYQAMGDYAANMLK